MSDGNGELQISIDERLRGGVWANFARVWHTPHEFTLDFVRLDGIEDDKRAGVVVARVSVSPLFVTQLIDALQDNWQQYASRAMPPEMRAHDDEDVSSDD
jgi:hypothetical protein